MREPSDEELTDDFADRDDTGEYRADTDAVVYCPYCGESVEIGLDPGGGASQQYVEDCQVCCQPWRVSLQYRSDGGADVSVTALDE